MRRLSRHWASGMLAVVAAATALVLLLSGAANANTALGVDITLSSDGSCDPAGPIELLVQSGTSVTFCYTLTNTTGTEIAFLELESDLFGTLLEGEENPILAAGETFDLQRTMVINTTTIESASLKARDQANTVYAGQGSATVNVCTLTPAVFVRQSAPAGGDGASWATAFNDLQDGLEVARICDGDVGEIRIAAGTYTPAPPNGDRLATFLLPDDTAIIGGYATNGSTNPVPGFVTVLSGDLNGNDSGPIDPTNVTRSDNSATVVTADNFDLPSVLRNLTISDGNANLTGGAFSASGGGIHLGATGMTTLENVTIENNTARDSGAGLLTTASIYLNNSIVRNNVARGGIARVGGGIRVIAGDFTATNVLIHDNVIDRLSSEGETSGGGLYVNSADATLTNVTVVNNIATGGSVSVGGGVGGNVNFPPNTIIVNSIIRDNAAPSGPNVDSGANATASYSNIEGGFAGTGNIDEDPAFLDAANGNFRLTHLSPSENTGDNAAVSAITDLDGSPRIQLGTVDMGAYETGLPAPRGFITLPFPCRLYSSSQAAGNLAGPFDGGERRTIQATGSAQATQGQSEECIPDGVTSAMVTITAANPQSLGNLRLSAAGIEPNGGVVNYQANGLSNTNTVTTEISLDGELDIFANSPLSLGSPSTDVEIDVVGYHPDSGGDGYLPITPCAVMDSRTSMGSTGAFAGPFSLEELPPVDVVGTFPAGQGGGNTSCGIPATATSVVLNAVSVGGSGDTGAILVRQPTVSIAGEFQVRFAPIGLNNAAVAVVPLAGGEHVEVFVGGTSQASTHVRLVAVGYYAANGGLNYVPITSCAAFDTRSGTGTFSGKRNGGTTTSFQITGSGNSAQGGLDDCGIPSAAESVLISNVAIQAEYTGNFQAFDTGGSPTGGILNFAPLAPAMNNSNAVPIPISTGGQMDLLTNTNNAGQANPAVHARGVILGYFE